MSLNERIDRITEKKDSLVCVGLDVNPERIPAHLMEGDDPVFRFCKQIIDATADLVSAYKPNLAFFEALGVDGWRILKRTVDYMPGHVLKIGDAKRGDIGSTAEKYAKSLFGLGFDAVTVNPYLGLDSVEPFIRDETRGVFILCLTSNPTSRDFQYLESGGRTLYQHIADKVCEWNTRDNCGLVVGATHPHELRELRTLAPDLPFLIPGIGAQGGDLEASVTAGTDDRGSKALINSSRGIIYASAGEDFPEAARRETLRLRDAVNKVRKQKEIR
ncbi:MAG TPA: orotidine-5'-phosphate decarboxylase [bacterium]|nr:orotidine-5'-phosphate decarboxylase [bacterium]